jgi:hypothetical protein
MSGQNVYGPATAPLFDPPPRRPNKRVRLALEETLWSWPDVVDGTKQSGLWVPPFDTLVVQIIVSQRVVGVASVAIVTSNGTIYSKTVSDMVDVTHYPTPPKVSAGGWIRADITAAGVQDLVISIRHARSAL